jgi:transposase
MARRQFFAIARLRYVESGSAEWLPPERLLRALLLQAFYTIRSERQLIEQLDYNLLYRWFVGLGVDEPVWVPTVFTKNRDRLLEADVARKFLAELMDHKELRGLLSDEHFSVDGTQIAAWASMKSFKAKDGSDDPPGSGRNGERNFHGEKRSNPTHVSTTDPEAQLYRRGRGKEAKLSFMGHTLMENRNGLIVAATMTKATGTAERKAAEEMRPAALRRYLQDAAPPNDQVFFARRDGLASGLAFAPAFPVAAPAASSGGAEVAAFVSSTGKATEAARALSQRSISRSTKWASLRAPAWVKWTPSPARRRRVWPSKSGPDWAKRPSSSTKPSHTST